MWPTTTTAKRWFERNTLDYFLRVDAVLVMQMYHATCKLLVTRKLIKGFSQPKSNKDTK